MVEQTETSLIALLTTIDAQIANIVGTLGTSGTGGAQFVDHSLGSKSISGSQRLNQLIESRKMYQELLNKIPKTIIQNHDYDINAQGENNSEFEGDQP